MAKKLKKLVKNPGIFFRDYFNKRYPVMNCELKVNEEQELSIYEAEKCLNELEKDLEYNFDIDVIYTWVNDNDKNWLNKKNKYLVGDGLNIKSSCDDSRFENHNELFYSVTSVKKNLPWIRNIYIVTDNQRPDWVDEFSNIYIINHSEIIKDDYLPTFNSHVIEANLYKIPDLSENFIYFNDDVLVAKPLDKSHFFKSNSIASLFVSAKKLSDMICKKNTPTLLASLNSQSILKERFNVNIENTLVHTYVPLKKSVFKEVCTEYNEQISLFQKNRFRKENDLNVATFLVPWYMFYKKKSVIALDVCYYFNIRSNNALMQYGSLLRMVDKPHSICVNDNYMKSNFDYRKELNIFLESYFKSS